MSTEEASAAIGQFGHIVTRTRSKRNPDGNHYDGYGSLEVDECEIEKKQETMVIKGFR